MRKGVKIPPSMGKFWGISSADRNKPEDSGTENLELVGGGRRGGCGRKNPAIRVQNRVLQVKVVNSVWMQELQFMKELIMQKLHQQTGKNILQDLRFFIGEIEPSGGKGRSKKKKSALLNGLSSDLSGAERERIDRALSGLTDPELREILGRIYARGLAAWKCRWRR